MYRLGGTGTGVSAKPVKPPRCAGGSAGVGTLQRPRPADRFGYAYFFTAGSGALGLVVISKLSVRNGVRGSPSWLAKLQTGLFAQA